MADDKKHGPVVTATIVIVTSVIFLGALWYAYKHELLLCIKWLCVVELYGIDLFVNDEQVTMMRELLLRTPKDGLEIDMPIKQALFLCGMYMRWVFVPAFFVMLYNSFMHPPKKMLRKSMDLDGLIEFQSKAWPYISPFVDYNPGKESARALGEPVPAKMPMFAEALAPEEWLVYSDVAINKDALSFDEGAAKLAFQKQLGKRWKGSADLPDHQRALLAAFALKGARKRTESDEFLGEIAKCWTRKHGFKANKKLKKEITKILRDPMIGHEAIRIANKHAYVNSALLGVLDWARSRGGVLAPAQFVWLRGQDRNLWYALNSLGRRTYFSEGSGSIAHYYIEKGIQKPLTTINVDNAVQSVKDYMEDHVPNIPPKAQATGKK